MGSSINKRFNFETLFKRNIIFQHDKVFIWMLVCIGAFLRLNQYLLNRSLWIDEAMLALNIINKPVVDYATAPLGFMVASKYLIQILGNNEYVLRSIALMSGIVSILLFWKLSSYFIQSKAIPIAIALFSISPHLIYYSAEVKPYSSDVATVLIIYLMVSNIETGRLTNYKVALFAIIGVVAIFFSYASIFILCSIAIVLTISCVKHKKWNEVLRLLVMCSIWACAFVGYYFVYVRSLANNQGLLNSWIDYNYYMPFPPKELWQVQWFHKTFFNIFSHPGGLFLVGIGALTFFVGCSSMFLRSGKKVIMLILPLIFVLLASALHMYPIEGRLLLFLAPAIIFLIAEGAAQIRICTANRMPIIGITVIILLFFHPVLLAIEKLNEPYMNQEEIKQAMSYLQNEWKSDDSLYIFNRSVLAFKYYEDKYGFDKRDYILGAADENEYLKDIYHLRGKSRVWFLFSHTIINKNDHEMLYLLVLNYLGKEISSFKAPGASVYLYNMRQKVIN